MVRTGALAPAGAGPGAARAHLLAVLDRGAAQRDDALAWLQATRHGDPGGVGGAGGHRPAVCDAGPVHGDDRRPVPAFLDGLARHDDRVSRSLRDEAYACEHPWLELVPRVV